MQVLSFLFHHAERMNREVVAMSSFRAAMEKRANYPNQQQAFAESIAEAKDITHGLCLITLHQTSHATCNTGCSCDLAVQTVPTADDVLLSTQRIQLV
jgi:hypothetical protein